MAAKPRVTVRLAPADLHALAYVAAKQGTSPAELARQIVSVELASVLRAHGWVQTCQEHYRAWLDEQAALGARAEAPDQRDYDRLAEGRLAESLAALHAPDAPAADPVQPPLVGEGGFVPLSRDELRARFAADRTREARS